MEFVRQIIDSNLLDKIVLPQSLQGKKVEIIVLPLSYDINEVSNKDSIDNFVGILDKYKNPNLVPNEKEAWAESMVEKHGSH